MIALSAICFLILSKVSTDAPILKNHTNYGENLTTSQLLINPLPLTLLLLDYYIALKFAKQIKMN